MKEKPCIILGVTGGIACYKSADLCSKLTGEGYDVFVVMTENARRLISDRIFFTLSQNPVLTDLFETPDWRPGHVDLASRAGLLVTAPATANFLGKLANGIADDALSTVALTFRGPMLVAPAMNSMMWESPAVQANLAVLKERGVRFIGPDEGKLACGPGGRGRMTDVPLLLEAIRKLLPV
ncbi:MAG: phosphopantothenoylcysteine decarboxylase [Lentisphaeria bacterium]|nr:phosphopantothenoylcysteine decarboxylase [Lentisphaeria bacterium]